MQEDQVRSVNRATRILQALGEGANSIKDISNAVDLSNSTVHRLLRALEASNFVIYDPNRRRYYLGPLLLKLADNPMISHNHLINCALDEMYRLRDISGETVALQIFAGVKRIFLEVVPSLQQIKHTEEKGNSVPLYAGSAGKVMLAELSQPDLGKIVRLMKAVDPVPEILKNEEEPYSTMRLDDDDGLHKDFLKTLNKYSEKKNAIISFPIGRRVKLDKQGEVKLGKRTNIKNIALGLTAIGFNILKCRCSHTQVHKHFKVYYEYLTDSYLLCCSKHCDSKRSFH